MANPDQIAKLDESVGAWNQLRKSQTITPDLSYVDFSGKDLSRADLHGADLRGVNFNGSDLAGASLREADLQGADLTGVKGGLQTEQFAGADLTGARLPDELKRLYDGLQNVKNISEGARKLFLAVLAACLYSWLTIATTTDLNLITNRAASPLPIIQTSIPIVGFFAVAPLLLLCVYVYFHFYLQKLWEELGSLPAILPDGRPLFAKIDPWLLNDLVRSHLPKLNVGRPFLSYFQLWISVLLAWWVVPLTMLLFWARYLPRHETIGTTFHVVLLTISLTAALRLYGLAVATLRGAERKPFGWKTTFSSRRGSQTAAFAIVVGTLFGLLSWGAIMGVPSDADVREMGNTVFVGGSPLRTGHLTWAPRLMALVGYSSFANLTRADVSQKKSTWKKNDSDLDSVLRAELKGANLRYALAHGAFFAGADLSGADLSGADLVAANMEGVDLSDANLNRALLSLVVLRNAELVHANLRGVDLNPGDAGDGVSDLRNADLLLADLSNARMRNANLSHAILRGTNLDSADLSYADLSDANLINANLQGADLSGANLASADLYDADLGGANLSGANLQGARLQGDNLRGAILKAADLTHANLRIADLSGTQLNGANLTYSDFREAKNLNFETVKAALHWEQAYYDNEGLKALVLASDHNSTLAKQEKKESELLRKPKSRDLPQKNSASRGNPLESDGGQNKGGSIK